jgi:hypothetical protein
MHTQQISVVSVHPDPAEPLAVDLKDLLAAFAPHLDQWIWCVRNLDWLGQDAEKLCGEVEAAGPAGLWISSQDLRQQAGGVHQTIEGEFLAFPRGIDPGTVDAAELNLATFSWNRAELGIVAVDGGFFDVLVKDPALLRCLKGFRDVRAEDPGNYF